MNSQVFPVWVDVLEAQVHLYQIQNINRVLSLLFLRNAFVLGSVWHRTQAPDKEMKTELRQRRSSQIDGALSVPEATAGM